ncbi:MAG: AAA family ATPase [Planctomycetes bacterium]|nr:AAA family ATPase [Planctomycetota bacterium]
MSLDLSEFRRFLDTEFRARFRSVIEQITLPIPQRMDQFTCWPGLTVRSCDPGSGRLELDFARNPSKLRAGEYVYVNRMSVEPKDVISGPEGVVEDIDQEHGICRLRPGYQQAARFQRLFRIGERLVLDQTLPAARMAREMPLLALRLLSGELGETTRTRRIDEILSGAAGPRPTGRTLVSADDDPQIARMTEAQRQALQRSIETDLALIQGPPGTGKTHTLGLIVRELVRTGLSVGVCAFTHQGIDNVLTECLAYEDITDVVKIGGRESGGLDLAHPRLRHYRGPGDFFRQNRKPCVTGFTQHAAFHPISRALDSGRAEDAMPDRFDVLVFDESGQLTLPAAVMAMLHADRFVFAGDHRQLPPVAQTLRPGFGAARSVFQHLVEEAGQPSVLLDETFRLHQELVTFPSETFYGGSLRASPAAADRHLDLAPESWGPARILDPSRPCQLVIVRHEGRGQESPEEAALIAMAVRDAVRGGIAPKEIAVIAPHRRQNVKIREYLAKVGLTGADPMVDTVERIQGQERDLVFLSMTLSDPEILAAEAGFLFLPNRFNVAITRARRKLVVVASPRFFRALPPSEALGGPTPATLDDLNVLKRWYFRQRASAVDATHEARCALKELEEFHLRPDPDQKDHQEPESATADDGGLPS